MAKFKIKRKIIKDVLNKHQLPHLTIFMSKSDKKLFDNAMRKEVENWQKRKDNKNKQTKI